MSAKTFAVDSQSSQARGSPDAAAHLPDDLDVDLAPVDAPEPAPSAGLAAPVGQQGSRQAKASYDEAVKAARAGDEKRAVHCFLEAAATAEAAHEWYLVAVSCQRVGEFLLDCQDTPDLERALRMYRRSAAAYERCGLFQEERDLSYTIMKIRLDRGRELGISWQKRAESYVYWLAAGFGFRPLRIFGTAIVVVLCYTLIYWLVGGAVHADTREAAGLWDSLYFSGITFTTVGYGDMLPAPHARMIALTEGFFGAFLMGVFVVTLTYRLARP